MEPGKLEAELWRYLSLRDEYDENRGKPFRNLIKKKYQDVAERLFDFVPDGYEIGGRIIKKAIIKTGTKEYRCLQLYTPEGYKRAVEFLKNRAEEGEPKE